MSEDDAAIRFREYSDANLPEPLRIQVLSFLRIVWPEGFIGPNRFRDWITKPHMQAHHLLYAAGTQLVSHLEIITATVTVNHVQYRVLSPTTVLTYPAFRREGWSSRLNARAAERIDNSTADIGVLTCTPNLIDFYSRAGWTLAPGAASVAGPDGYTWTSNDVLLTRPTSAKSTRFLEDLKQHPMRVVDEW
jgi:hypothetical protein